MSPRRGTLTREVLKVVGETILADLLELVVVLSLSSHVLLHRMLALVDGDDGCTDCLGDLGINCHLEGGPFRHGDNRNGYGLGTRSAVRKLPWVNYSAQSASTNLISRPN